MAANDLINVAVQGTGTVSTEHIKAYLRNPHCRLVALGSRTTEGAAQKARQLGIDPSTIAIYDSIDDLVAHPGLDALSICTPHQRHHLDAIAAANAGKHFLVEKPAAMNLEDLHAMDEAVQKAGVITAVGFVLRWNPLVLTAQSLIQDGAFGDLLYVQTDYWHNTQQSGYPNSAKHLWKAKSSAMLAGGCHAIDLARFLMGSDIVEVTAMEFTATPGLEFPPNQAALVRFENGRVGKVSACTEPWIPYQFNIDLLGTDGGLRDNRFYSRKLPGALDWASFPTILPNNGLVEHHPFQGEIDDFIDCVRRGVESQVSMRDAVNTHEACFAIDRSGAEGATTIQLPLSVDV
jgi:predicted dehydrogenase